jgi:hypothetical protein
LRSIVDRIGVLAGNEGKSGEIEIFMRCGTLSNYPNPLKLFKTSNKF